MGQSDNILRDLSDEFEDNGMTFYDCQRKVFVYQALLSIHWSGLSLSYFPDYVNIFHVYE